MPKSQKQPIANHHHAHDFACPKTRCGKRIYARSKTNRGLQATTITTCSLHPKDLQNRNKRANISSLSRPNHRAIIRFLPPLCTVRGKCPHRPEPRSQRLGYPTLWVGFNRPEPPDPAPKNKNDETNPFRRKQKANI